MSLFNNGMDGKGGELARRLGLQLNPSEGHNLAGPCISCKSSDAFSLHKQLGVAHCFSCNGKWSPFQLAETVLGDRECAKALLVEIGLFQANSGSGVASRAIDPVEEIAHRKGVTPDSLRDFGAQAISANAIRLPAYGPDGEQCTSFTLNVMGGKGMFAKGNPAGLFFPHEEGKVRLPKPGET